MALIRIDHLESEMEEYAFVLEQDKLNLTAERDLLVTQVKAEQKEAREAIHLAAEILGARDHYKKALASIVGEAANLGDAVAVAVKALEGPQAPDKSIAQALWNGNKVDKREAK